MKPKHKNKYAAVLLKAAELIDDHREIYCCGAIGVANRNVWHSNVEAYFHHWMMPPWERPHYAYFSYPAPKAEAERRQHRILALLLVSLLASEGRNSPGGRQ